MSACRLGSFEVVEKIAAGGMGDIWRGIHVAQQLPVAIKVLRGGSTQAQEFKSLFRREVRAVARFDHPGIVTVFDTGDVPAETADAVGGALDPGSPYLVMEYLERGSLESVPNPLSWPTAYETLMAVLDGLAHAHARGIIHRDLKPANILLADRASGSPIRLTDFGIAFWHRAANATEADGRVSGTPAYMAPEQFLGEWRDFGPWTDLYALGCVAYHLASGTVPFWERNQLQLAAAHVTQPPPLFQRPADYPAGFEEWVMRLLAKEPTERYGRCADAAAALAALASTAASGTRPAPLWALPEPEPVEAPADWRAPAPPQRPFKLVGAGLRLFDFRTVPMVDRTAERDRLWAMFRRVALSGKPGLVVLEGSAGTGKSRLAEWVCERTHELGLADTLKAPYDRSRGHGSALGQMVAAAWSTLGSGAADLQDRVSAVLSRAGVRSARIGQAVAEFLAPATLGSDFNPGMFDVTPSRSAGFRSLFEALRGVYGQRTLVMWLDDVHRDIEGLHFVRYVLDRAETEPFRMLAVVTAREDLLVESPEALDLLQALCEEDATERVHVEPLAEADSRQLVSSLLHLEGDLAERVSVRSGGNPLYATQLVGDWVNRGILEAGSTGFVLAESAVPDVPDDVHALWMRRLDRVLDECVGAAERTAPAAAERTQLQVLLELAAALGDSVDMAEWVALCSLAGVTDPTPVLQPLFALRLAQLDTDGWAFSHRMLRDSIERIARERDRWESHNRRCADMLEQHRPVPHWGDSERIGRHRFAGGQYAESLRPLFRGAKERARREEYAAALELLQLYDRSLDALGQPQDDPRRLDGWLLQADLHCTRQALGAAEELADRTAAQARGVERERFRGAALMVRARVRQQQGLVRAALTEYRSALEALRTTGRTGRVAACSSEQARAMVEVDLLDEAWQSFQEAQEIYEEIGEFVPWAENQLGLASVLLRQGEAEHAETLCRRVRAFGRREGLHRVEAAACVAVSEVETAAGRLPDAVRSLDESITLFDGLGFERQALRARGLRVLLLLESGAEDEAQEAFAPLQHLPTVEVPLPSRLLVSGVGLAIAAAGSSADFESRIGRIETLLTETDGPTRDLTRCLRIAIARARARTFPERAERIEQLIPPSPPAPRPGA